MKPAEMTYLVLGIIIGVVLASVVKPNDHAAMAAAAAAAAANKPSPLPATPLTVPVPVPVPVPCPPTAANPVAVVPAAPVSAASGPDTFPKPPAPYTVPRISNPGHRDCSRAEGDKVTIRASEIRAIEPEKWQKYKANCCYPEQQASLQADAMKAWNGKAGVEHYALLSFLANHFGETAAGGMFGELGSKEGSSAMAMGVHPKVTVYAYDVVPVFNHIGNVMRSRQNREITPMDVQLAMPNLHFIKANLSDSTQPLNAYWRKLLLGTRVMLLDTLHFPESNPFEYEMLEYLDEHGFGGILVLDDINLSPEMKTFWKWCTDKFGDRATDVTRIGHATGTGYIDFCGNTEFIWDI